MMAPRHGYKDLSFLKDLSKNKPIYLGVDNDRHLLFRTNLRFVASSNQHLTERHLISLGLTEVCCEIGFGKVRKFSVL